MLLIHPVTYWQTNDLSLENKSNHYVKINLFQKVFIHYRPFEESPLWFYGIAGKCDS